MKAFEIRNTDFTLESHILKLYILKYTIIVAYMNI